MAWGTVVKCAWSDKFRVPTAVEIREGLAVQSRPVLDEARHRLSELPGVSESLVWQGVPWRWTFVYAGTEHDSRASAYLIPDPQRLQVCIPLSQEQIEQFPLKRMKKSIRDGIVYARNVGGVWWPTWEVPTVGALGEVIDLLNRKNKLVGAGQLPVEA
jgi:hypothetical protein